MRRGRKSWESNIPKMNTPEIIAEQERLMKEIHELDVELTNCERNHEARNNLPA